MVFSRTYFLHNEFYCSPLKASVVHEDVDLAISLETNVKNIGTRSNDLKLIKSSKRSNFGSPSRIPDPEPRMFSYLGFELLYFILEILSKRSSLVEISFKRLFRDLQAWLAGSAMQLARLRPQSSVNRDSARFLFILMYAIASRRQPTRATRGRVTFFEEFCPAGLF